ncbi:MAG: hypothetical protein JRN15_02240 [Nitrososphaerota archaeon]|nr:hypothetical protein [Nitrososphaerota archaeon]
MTKTNPFKRRDSPLPDIVPQNLLQLLGRSTDDGMLDSLLKNTSMEPRSVYSRLSQFTDYYEGGLWNITSEHALEMLEIFRKAYEIIVDEDRRTAINTCKGYCETFGIACVAVDSDKFYAQFQRAVDIVSANSITVAVTPKD